MKPLYTPEEFKIAKSLDLLPCECYECNQPFNLRKEDIHRVLNPNSSNTGQFCSKECRITNRDIKETVICSICNLEFRKKQCEIKKSKNGNHFCSKSCSATYSNRNKTHGNKRSKLEIWLEEQLTILYSDLPIDFNKKSAIGSELDIYIPSLNLGIELNGILHYEPIYGLNKLDQIQNNDKSKSLACHEAKIDLCVLDTSGQKYFKPSTSQKYLDIITNIINERLLIT